MMRHLQVQPNDQVFQIGPTPGSASPLTTGAPAFTKVRPRRASPLQQAGYLLRPDLAGDVPQAARAESQPNRVRHAAISPRWPPQAGPGHPATQEVAGRQAPPVSPPHLGPIECLRSGTALRAPSLPGVRPQLSWSAGSRPPAGAPARTQRCRAQAPSMPWSDPTTEGLGS
ncbi:hypothetical protein NDU88_009617 [Pleurodeles waltl]|uniref:Uncharacterized protein n=1 Tax=Pleurodeles waltl TaxID=8319 RepID=A0AAV7QS19_PLEWA|nr:hypothetical protein NDU88_009617 [Pleurodeles waltl]